MDIIIIVTEADIKAVLATPPTPGKKLLPWPARLQGKAPFNILEDVDVVNVPEVHDDWVDAWRVLEGQVEFIIGGQLVGPREVAGKRGEWVGAAIDGGRRFLFRVGDEFDIPAGVPHQHIHRSAEHGPAVRMAIRKVPARK